MGKMRSAYLGKLIEVRVHFVFPQHVLGELTLRLNAAPVLQHAAKVHRYGSVINPVVLKQGTT